MNPFIPLKKAQVVIIDGRVDIEIEESLKKHNLKIIKTIKCEEVDESISYHPDIVIHPINYNTLIVAPNVFDYYEENLSGLGIKLIRGEKYLNSKYPEDIAYNVGRLANHAVHNFKYTDEILKFYLKKEKIGLVNVNQGYSKCSLSIVSKNAGITSDIPIYNKLKSLGYNMLLINPKYIELKGQNYGFIGGTNGHLSPEKSIISGNLDCHPNKEDIIEFYKENNMELIFLSKKNILDIGTIITLNVN